MFVTTGATSKCFFDAHNVLGHIKLSYTLSAAASVDTTFMMSEPYLASSSGLSFSATPKAMPRAWRNVQSKPLSLSAKTH